MAQTHRLAQVPAVLQGVISLLADHLQQRRVQLEIALPATLPDTAIDQGLLRQILLSMLGYLAERTERATIRLEAQVQPTTVSLSLRIQPPGAAGPTDPEATQQRVATLNDLAVLSGARIRPAYLQGAITGFDIVLPSGQQPIVLVVDDNEDVLVLFQRYLGLHHYQVVTAQTCPQALALARQLRPQAITLDLMMPGQDGWETLQTLLNQPETRNIPVIVCSVLRERELALSLGATAFLEKPVSEQDLLAVLQALS